MNRLKPNRVAHSYVQTIKAKPEDVFPLLCPVREADWIEGWDPLLIISNSGVVEEGCVFVTQADDDESIWYVTRHDVEHFFVEMIKITPAVTVCKLRIQLEAYHDDTHSIVEYEYTSLGERGDAFLKTFTHEYYERFMQLWEKMMNHYLQKGTRLPLQA